MGAQFGVNDADWKTIDGECGPAERILWVGRPRPIRMLLRDTTALWTAALSTFSLLVMIVIMNWVYGSVSLNVQVGNMPTPFSTLFSLVFIGALAFNLVPLALVVFQGGRTLYAITGQRVLIVTLPALWWGQSVQTFTAEDMGGLTRTTLADGSGDLVFGSEVYSVRGRSGRRMRTRKIGFWGVPDVIQVEQMLLMTFKHLDR